LKIRPQTLKKQTSNNTSSVFSACSAAESSGACARLTLPRGSDSFHTRMLKRTPFFEFHVSAGAKMVDFAGWEMPLMYRGIVEEHVQTRSSGSMFDVSHMGRVHFSGPDAQEFLSKVVTRNVADQKVGQSRYSLVCNAGGGVMDDVIVSRDSKHWLVVCNASNREKLLSHFGDVRRSTGMDLDISDQTEASGMVAVQGPRVIERVGEALSVDVASMKRYTFVSDSVMLIKYSLFRSGYTGEDGVEIILPAKAATMAMKMLGGRMDNPDATIKPAGLGARDTLRLEAGMPLYGHELGESIDPISAGLGWAVDVTKDFIGVEAIRVIKEKGPARKLVGLELEGRRIARQGVPVQTSDGKVIGEVTSGTFGPTLQKSIAMAYVDSNFAAEGTSLQVDLKGTLNPAKVVKLPFYKRP
jgi:aminomethyltransferase